MVTPMRMARVRIVCNRLRGKPHTLFGMGNTVHQTPCLRTQQKRHQHDQHDDGGFGVAGVKHAGNYAKWHFVIVRTLLNAAQNNLTTQQALEVLGLPYKREREALPAKGRCIHSKWHAARCLALLLRT